MRFSPPTVLQVEPGYSQEALEILRGHGPTNVWASRDLFFGGVHAVVPRRGEGAGDDRRAANAGHSAVAVTLP